MIKLHFLYKAVADLLYPKACELCNKVISHPTIPICYSCVASIPKSNFSSIEFNLLKDKLYDIANLKYCIAIYKYQKENKAQRLIHLLKYQSKKRIGLYFAGEIAQIIENKQLKFDYIIALPMHQSKEKIRGFNQTKIIANSLSKRIGIPVIDKIEKWEDTESQTKKSIYQRWANQEKKFKLKHKSNIASKHILIVDDVITTGATMHACLKLFEKMDTTISVACIAYS
tara:strand:- start:1180 stop:1863 length:684 start_codon:yes stop_codon:yes gene_type:complete